MTGMSPQYQYLEFVRHLLHQEPITASCVEGMDWTDFARFVREQSIAGVVFDGLQRWGGSDVKPPLRLLLEWTAMAGRIEEMNRLVNRRTVKLCGQLQKDGFDCCVLKGQGNTLMYPNVYSRMPGDIDVWMLPAVRDEGVLSAIRETIRYVKRHDAKARAVYLHIDYGDYEGTEVEVHYRPSFLVHPVHNCRLQRWFWNQAEEQFQHRVALPDDVGDVCIPTREFNLIFQLSHIYKHVLQEGIGLRQMIDYYYLLRGVEEGQLGAGSIERTLRYLGLRKIAGALMWVLHEVLGLEERYLIAPMDERLGKVLLAEILNGGNFGMYDEANLRADSPMKKNWQRLRRDLRMVRFFPPECLWEPPFRIYHFFWRLWYNRI